jgi:phosphatidylinositol alpha-mannosyltransferase
MKIGIVCPYNLAMPGGVQQHVFEQARELRARGHTVAIVTPKPRGELLMNDPGIIFLGSSARFRTPQHTSVDVSISVTTEAIDALLEEQNFDVIHFHEPLVPILARQMLPRVTCPVVGTFHAAMPETTIGKSIAGSIAPFVKSVVKHVSIATAVSHAATSYISGYVDESDIRFIPNGVDISFYAPKKPTRRKGVLYIGRLEKRKGVKHLIEAFAELLAYRPDEQLYIAGNGPDREKLERLVEELGISRAVTFLGFISEEKKRSLLQSTALFVSPALYGESFGIVLIEAMAAGAIVMGGHNPGYASVLSGKGSVGLINPHDAALFANRMHLLLSDEDMRTMLAKWAKNDVKKYSYKEIVTSYENIYRSLVS